MARVLKGLMGCLELERGTVGEMLQAGAMAKYIVGLEFGTSPNIGLLGLRREELYTLRYSSGARSFVLSSLFHTFVFHNQDFEERLITT